MEQAREPERRRETSEAEDEAAASSGVRCPYCKADLVDEALAGACSACGTLHHLQCFGDHGGCSTHGCGSSRARSVKVGEAELPRDFAGQTCATCRQPVARDVMVARCNGCAQSMHVACYEQVRSCPGGVVGACRGTIELMHHAEAVALQLRRMSTHLMWIWGVFAAMFAGFVALFAGRAPPGALGVLGALAGACALAGAIMAASFRNRAAWLEASARARAPSPPRTGPKGLSGSGDAPGA